MATIDPPHLRWTLDEHASGETVRVAIQLAGIATQSVQALDFIMEQENATVPLRATASLVGSVTPGQNGVQPIADPTVLVPPLPAGQTTFEAVIETSPAASSPLPPGYYRCAWKMTWAYGIRVVSAGRLHLREPSWA